MSFESLKDLHGALVKSSLSPTVTTSPYVLIAIAVLTSTALFAVSIAYLELKYSPSATKLWSILCINLLNLLSIVINGNIIGQSVRRWWLTRERRKKQLEVEWQNQAELDLAGQVGSGLLADIYLADRLRFQGALCGVRNSWLPNVTTISTSIFVVLISTPLALWFSGSATLVSKFATLTAQSFVYVCLVTFFGTFVTASLYQTMRLVREQEEYLRLAIIIERARQMQA